MSKDNNSQSADPNAQTSQNENNNSNNNNGDDFVPELSREEYAEKWRQTSAEAAKYRKANASLKEKLEAREKAEMESQGKYKEMYENLNQEHSKLKGGLKAGMVKSSVKQQLLDLGCNPKMVDKAIVHADIQGIETDPETFRPSEEQVLFEAKRIKQEVPMFFGSTYRDPNDGEPGEVIGGGKKSVKDMSDEELSKAYAKALQPD